MKFDYIETALITDSEIEKEGQRLIPYIEHIKSVILHNGYDEPEASLNLATDETFLTVSQTLSKQMQPQSLSVLWFLVY